MDEKKKRSYNARRRQEQARETRQAILAAARHLFPALGYEKTTIDMIAQDAGVASETIYASFGSKRAILAGLIGVLVGGDDQPIPLMERSGPQAVLLAPDAPTVLRLFADDITGILTRVAPIFEVLRMAAKSEPEIKSQLEQALQTRFKNIGMMASRLAAHGPLRNGMTVTQATETAWALTDPGLFRLMTVERGWASDRYAAWLADSLIRLLLP